MKKYLIPFIVVYVSILTFALAVKPKVKLRVSVRQDKYDIPSKRLIVQGAFAEIYDWQNPCKYHYAPRIPYQTNHYNFYTNNDTGEVYTNYNVILERNMTKAEFGVYVDKGLYTTNDGVHNWSVYEVENEGIGNRATEMFIGELRSELQSLNPYVKVERITE